MLISYIDFRLETGVKFAPGRDDESSKTILFASGKLNRREEQRVNLLIVTQRIINHVNMGF